MFGRKLPHSANIDCYLRGTCGEEGWRAQGWNLSPERLMGKGNSLLLGGGNSVSLIIKIDQDVGKSQRSIVAESVNSGPGLPGFRSHLCPLARFLSFPSPYHKGG